MPSSKRRDGSSAKGDGSSKPGVKPSTTSMTRNGAPITAGSSHRSRGVGGGTDVPSSAVRMRHSRTMLEALGSFLTSGGRRNTQRYSPLPSRYSAFAMPVLAPKRSAVREEPPPGRRSPIHASRRSVSRSSSSPMIVTIGGLTVTVNRVRVRQVIDFEIPDDIKQLRARVAEFIDTQVTPVEPEVGTRPFFDIVKEQQANAIVQIEVGRSFSHLGAWALNCMGLQDATMLTLVEHGTEEQKQRYLVPLVNGDIRICFSMTEKAAGADATGMQTTAVRRGDDWVLNGEKWFSSGASMSQLALVMAKTDPDAPRHRRVSTCLVEPPKPPPP